MLGLICYKETIISAHCTSSQEEIVRYKKQYEDMLIERNKFKQQCTQVSTALLSQFCIFLPSGHTTVGPGSKRAQ